MIFLSVFLCLVSALFVWETGQDCPTLLSRSFWASNENWGGVFFKNYSVIASPDPDQSVSGCSIPPDFKAKDQIIGFFPGNCAVEQSLSNINAAGAVAALQATGLDDLYALFLGTEYGYALFSNPVAPAFFCSSMSIDVPLNFSYNSDNTAIAIIFNIYYGGMNQTVLLTPPVGNKMWLNWNTYGSATQFAFASCLIASLVAFAMSAVKFIAFYHLVGLKLYVPQVQLLLCFAGSVVGIYLSFSGIYVWRGMYDYHIWSFFQLWCLGFAYTVCLLMGLFFTELSFLSSSELLLFFCCTS
jgi:hypothetical protein